MKSISNWPLLSLLKYVRPFHLPEDKSGGKKGEGEGNWRGRKGWDLRGKAITGMMSESW